MFPARMVLITLLLALPVTGLTAEENCPVDFSLDTSHAVLLANALADGTLSSEEITRFVDHPRTADVIRKTRSFGLEVDRAMLASQLEQLGQGIPVTDISFGLARYPERLESTLSMLQSLDGSLAAFMDSICGRLAPYLPAGARYTQSIVVVSAVNSTGFTFDDFYRKAI